MSTETAAAEPVCCDAPMVHNSWSGEYECADAYFALLDGGVLGDVGLRVELADLTDYQRERYEHWLTKRRKDNDETMTSHSGGYPRFDPGVELVVDAHNGLETWTGADWNKYVAAAERNLNLVTVRLVECPPSVELGESTTCGACPVDCVSCTLEQETCECYEHAEVNTGE